MVDKSIGELVAASQINDNDLFVLEQSGEAKKLLGNLLKQYINRNVMSVSVSALPPDSEPTVSYDPNTGALELGIPRGEKGESGESYAGYVSGIVKGDGAGGVSAAVAGTDFAAMSNLPTRNLLDNPWFTVNQRAKESYTSSGYTVDRWIADNGGTSVSASGITLAISVVVLHQYFEDDVWKWLGGRQVTLSIMTADGTVYSHTRSCPDYRVGVDAEQRFFANGWRYQLYSTSSGLQVRIIGVNGASDVAIRAVKLELGEVSTLANDVPPNYMEELRKCQEYLMPLGGGLSGGDSTYIGYIASSKTLAEFSIAKMRVKNSGNAGTIIYSDLNDFFIGLPTGGTWVSPTSVSLRADSDGMAIFRATINESSQFRCPAFLLPSKAGLFVSEEL